MIKPSIVIFDPLYTDESHEILTIIKNDTPYDCAIVREANVNQSIRADLIFVSLHPDRSPDYKNLYHQFSQHFQAIPAIGVLNKRFCSPNCPIFQKHLWSFISTPFQKQDILLNIHKYLGYTEPVNYSKKNIDASIKAKLGFNLLKGDSCCLTQVKEKIYRVAPYNVPILIRGDTGTGKELSAKLIHFLSPRSERPFVPLNCGAIPKELFENELFGHKKGAYTDAHISDTGVIAAAEGGTLFLDEVESLPLSAQVKLLRFLEEKQYKPLGQSTYLQADVRIIAAAKGQLWEMVKSNLFRDDLFYRLNVVQINLPLLKERREDIPSLVNHFIKQHAILFQKNIKGIKPAALLKLIHHQWQGNVRELENVLQEAVINTTSKWIETKNINFKKLSYNEILASNTSSEFHHLQSLEDAKKDMLTAFEKKYIINVLTITRGNIAQAAKYSQKDRRAFYRLLKKHQVNLEEFRA